MPHPNYNPFGYAVGVVAGLLVRKEEFSKNVTEFFNITNAELFAYLLHDIHAPYKEVWESVGIPYYQGRVIHLILGADTLDWRTPISLDLVRAMHGKYLRSLREIEIEYGFMRSELDRFCLLVDAMTDDWARHDGQITCEFSTTQADIEEKQAYLDSISVPGGRWVMHLCDVCMEQDGLYPYHVEITRT